jgi:hypothetical protein
MRITGFSSAFWYDSLCSLKNSKMGPAVTDLFRYN